MSSGSINHIGIATNSLDNAENFWNLLGYSRIHDDTVEGQGVKIRYMKGKESPTIELLEPLGEDSPVARFISKRGPGVQQIAINVTDISAKIEELIGIGVRMINEEPLIGSGGHRIAFIHPYSSGGVLIELVESIT